MMNTAPKMTITTTLAEAIAQGYVVMREAHQVYTAFFRNCQETDAPFIYAKLRPTYTAIFIDLIGQSYRMTEACWHESHHHSVATHTSRGGGSCLPRACGYPVTA